jgi:hypothetical protein
MAILWPSCKQIAMEHHPTDGMDYARATFAIHAINDPAWRELGEDAIFDFIDRLE